MYTKLTTVLLLLLFVISNGAMAKTSLNEDNKVGISFNHNSWSEILEEAKTQDKLIFVDCYTTWCGPCKMMSKTVFTDQEVGEYFNQQYVNVKLDMEKEPGISLKAKFGINAYPTLLIIDADENIVHKLVGAMPKAEFLSFAKEANGTHSLSAFHKRYQEKGVSDADFVFEYIKKLETAGEKSILTNVVERYFKKINKNALVEKQNWDVLNKYVHNIDHEAFQYLLSNKKKFVDAYGEKAIEDKVYFTFLREGNGLCDKQEDGKYSLNQNRKENFIAELNKNELKNKNRILAYSEISTARTTGNWSVYIASISKYLKANVIDKGAMSLYNYALPIDRAVSDIELRKEAAKWCELGIKIEGLSEGYINAFKNLQKQLNTVRKDQ